MTADLQKLPKWQSPTPSAPPAFAERELLATVSLGFVEDWLQSLQRICSASDYSRFLHQAGFKSEFLAQPNARLTHDQFVKLYQVFATETGDEMMGLWSRSIRTGALKYLCKTIIDAPSIKTALYRFTRFWNLLLDDYALDMVEDNDTISIVLRPYEEGRSPNRFGHALLLKLTHGIVSWLAGWEMPVEHVWFQFTRPPFAEDYPILFPSAVSFDAKHSAIAFSQSIGRLQIERKPADMRAFLERAPRDWIFTAFREHALQLKVREFLYVNDHPDWSLEQAARFLNMSPRTLIRKLAAEDRSFQAIKDGLRRDIAIRDLKGSSKSMDEISWSIGFTSSAVFHRAFKSWTGMTPGEYRRAFQRA